MDYKIIEMSAKDWNQVKEIYRKGIETGNATFQIEIPTWEEWDNSHIMRMSD